MTACWLPIEQGASAMRFCALLVGSALIATACGGGSEDTGEATRTAEVTATPAPTEAPAPTPTDEPAPPPTEPPVDPRRSLSVWSRVPHDDAVFRAETLQLVTGVTAGGPGVVAVGFGDGNAVVWTSPDGLSWSRVPNDDARLRRFWRQWPVNVECGRRRAGVSSGRSGCHGCRGVDLR